MSFRVLIELETIVILYNVCNITISITEFRFSALGGDATKRIGSDRSLQALLQTSRLYQLQATIRLPRQSRDPNSADRDCKDHVSAIQVPRHDRLAVCCRPVHDAKWLSRGPPPLPWLMTPWAARRLWHHRTFVHVHRMHWRAHAVHVRERLLHFLHGIRRVRQAATRYCDHGR